MIRSGKRWCYLYMGSRSEECNLCINESMFAEKTMLDLRNETYNKVYKLSRPIICLFRLHVKVEEMHKNLIIISLSDA